MNTGETYYRLYCDYCGYNKVTNGQDSKGLVEYKRSPIQKGIPQYDAAKREIKPPELFHHPKQFKCPGCGRLIRGRKLTGVLNGNDASKSERDQTGTHGPQVPGKPSPYFESGRSEI